MVLFSQKIEGMQGGWNPSMFTVIVHTIILCDIMYVASYAYHMHDTNLKYGYAMTT